MNRIDHFLPKGARPLWAAAGVSAVGDALHDVAILWLIYELTGSPTATGLLGVARYLPSILIGIFAGAWVDRVSRKSVLLWCDGLRVILVGALAMFTITHTINSPGLYSLAFMIAICTVFFLPARDAILSQLVSLSELGRATSVLQSSFALAFIIGPLLAATALPVIGLSGLFALDSLTYAISFCFLLALKPAPIPRIEQTVSARDMMREGLVFARHSSLISGLLLVTTVDNLFIMGLAIVGTPIYVRAHLGLGAEAYALILACFAFGMLVGSLLYNFLGDRLPRGKTLLWALAFDGLTFIPFYFSNELWSTVLLMFIHSLGIPFILIPRTSMIQSEVPVELQGRIFSLVQLTVVGLTALSSGLVGMLLEVWSPPLLFAAFGLIAACVGATGFLFKDLRRLR